MKNTFIFSFFFSCGLVGFAQNHLVKQWDKRFGGYDCDEIFAFQQTTDGGYILGGWSQSDSSADKTENAQGRFDFWIVKTDALGNKQWDKIFSVGDYNKLYALKQTVDGGYFLGGYSGSSTNHDFWVVKVTSTGDMEWNKGYGGTGNDELNSLQQTADGGYILGGYSSSGISGDKTEASRGLLDYWIVKIDSTGNKLWDKGYGGSKDDLLYSMAQTRDGGYVLGGYSYSGINGDKTQANWDTSFLTSDFWVVKTNALGNIQWDRRFGGNNMEYLGSLQQTYDGGFILGGNSRSDSSGDKTQANWDLTLSSFDYWIVKIDSLGIMSWNKRFGGVNDEAVFGNVLQTSDSGYLLAGTSYSSYSGDKTEFNLGPEQAWVVKTNFNGNKLWDKTILTNGHDEGAYAMQTGDGCYAIAVSTPSGLGGYKTEANANPTQLGNPLANYFFFRDYWLVKFRDTTYCSLFSPTIQATQPIFCAGDSAQLCAMAAALSYLWNTGETSNCIYANQAGNYYVTVTDANSCSAVSNHLAINVYPLPPVSISVNGNTLTSFNGVNHQWYLNDTAINGANDSIYTAGQTGIYTVEISDSNGCHTFSNPVTVTVSGITSFSIHQSPISIFPNPAISQLFIQTNGAVITEINIYNTLGSVVMRTALTQNAIDISKLSTGIYFVEINVAVEKVVRKFVKE